MGFWRRVLGLPEATKKIDDQDQAENNESVETENNVNESESDEKVSQENESEVAAQDQNEESTEVDVDEGDSKKSKTFPATKVKNEPEAKEKVEEVAEIEHEDQVDDEEMTDEAEKDHEETTDDEDSTEDIDQAEEPETPEINEYNEDLKVLDGRLLPQLEVPNWREELEFVKERYEPCDLSEHIVKVSKRRLFAKRIDHELAESRLSAYNRYLERATRRFKEKIDEDAHLRNVYLDLAEWQNTQAKTISWKLANRISQELTKAREAEAEAKKIIESSTEFVNKEAILTFSFFARKTIFIPILTAYILSVVSLTYNRFEWIIKFLPFFNLGLAKVNYMILGIASGFMLMHLWRYSKEVMKIQRQLRAFVEIRKEQYDRIKHSVKQLTRLSQQQPIFESILQVMAIAYRVQLDAQITGKANVTTAFEPNKLPACVTLARADHSDVNKIPRLKRRALRVLMSPGWRTRGLDEITQIYADSQMLDAASLSLNNLDSDSYVSAKSAQKMLLNAFADTSIHDRVSKARLRRAILDLHAEVLTNWDSPDRPRVISLRQDGFNKLSFQTSWLVDEDISADWKEFLTEILQENTAPFSNFNILDKTSEINNERLIKSVAVVPKYFKVESSKVRIQKSKTEEVMPIDIVVRVDVSPWADPSAFAVFADDLSSVRGQNSVRTESAETDTYA